MNLAIEMIGWWTLLSCTAGPLAAWMFFYPLRRERAAHQRWIAQRQEIVSPHISKSCFSRSVSMSEACPFSIGVPPNFLGNDGRE